MPADGNEADAVRQRVRGGIARERRIEQGRQLQLDLEPAVFQAGDQTRRVAIPFYDKESARARA